MGAKGSISLTFNELTPALAAALVAVVAKGATVETVIPPIAAPAPAAPAVSSPIMQPAPVAPAVAVAQPTVAAPVATPTVSAPPASGVTQQQLVDAVKAFASAPNKGGPAKVKEILASLGVAKALDLQPHQYAQAYAAFTA